MWKTIIKEIDYFLNELKNNNLEPININNKDFFHKLNLKENIYLNNSFFEKIDDYRLSFLDEEIKFKFEIYDISIDLGTYSKKFYEKSYKFEMENDNEEIIQILTKNRYRYLYFLSDKQLEITYKNSKNILIKLFDKNNQIMFEEKQTLNKLKKNLNDKNQNDISLLLTDIEIYKILNNSLFFLKILNEDNIFEITEPNKIKNKVKVIK